MKFTSWTIEELISWLQRMKTSPDFDYHRVQRVRGEIIIENGELRRTINNE